MFGYTCFIDVTARGEGRRTWPASLPMSWLGKSFDTFAPLGPCIVTADEIANPNDLLVRFWNDGQLRHNYNTDDMEHHVPELVEFATTVMTMMSGDIIACGTNHEGLGALQDGETVEIEVQGIGRMSLKVADPLKRTWERGVYMGADSTHPEGGQAPSATQSSGDRHTSKECVMKADDLNLKPQYRMPRVFGALPGPRNVPKDKQNLPDNQTDLLVAVTALTDAKRLAELLPPDCSLDGEPLLTVSMSFKSNIGWLAGRGYSILRTSFRIAYSSPIVAG